MKRIFAILLFSFLLLPNFAFSAEKAKTVYISFFYGQGCPHCEKEAKFLEKIKSEFPNVQISAFEVYHHPENAKLMKEVGEKLNKNVSGVPFLVIGGEAIIGYLNDQTTGAKIKNIVEEHSQTGCYNIVDEVLEGEKPCEKTEESRKINLPFFGEIDTSSWSLPVLTVAIAGVDGFNPCAMWVLIFLISMLLGMENRKKMWLLGSAFIAASALVYFLFLSAWLNLFLFIGFIGLVRVAIGIVAVLSGGYHLREYWQNKEGVCKATDEKRKQKIINKFKQILEEKNFWLALAGIVVLAFAVNLIELVCSAGLPAIYTQVLSLSNLSALSYYSYLLLYIFIFMLDDLIVFIVAMTTLRLAGLNAKYSCYSNLIGGIIILVLGILLIFKPEWIMFG